ncbi:MAG: rane protein of unknown function [Mycobacterium sp.]|nr:rane protein of unknown function [Mycobacterium sp.]
MQTGRKRAAARATRVARLLLAGLARWVLRIGLPLGCAAAVVQAFPYRATVEGVPFEVQGTLLHRTGLSADTTLGSWEFPDVNLLPFGVHITPRNVDVLQLVRAANGDTAGYARRLQAGFVDQLPQILTWLAAEVLIGVLLGLVAAAAINMALRYLRGRSRREHELRIRLQQLGAAVVVLAIVAGVGAATYNPRWLRQSRLTGTLAAAQLFPDQLSAFYSRQSKVFNVLDSVVGLQAALQSRLDAQAAPQTALRIMFISDMHLAANYPLVARYAASYGVNLIVNTGDEAEFGTNLELTPAYLDALRAVTVVTPMLWLAGNHDAPDVVTTLRTIPGVTVLGSKTATPDGYAVTGDVVHAFGLTVAGLADPRVYGGSGAYGSDTPSVTDPLERRAVAAAVAGLTARAASPTPTGSATPATPTAGGSPGSAGHTTFDIFATHEPPAAAELRAQLAGQIRQTNAGHTHAQNKPGDLQQGTTITLVEGSTGAGGLDNLSHGSARPPIEFSIESVAPDCEFTRIVRFQIAATPGSAAGGTVAADPALAQAYGDDVTASTIYFRPQGVAPGRTCGVDLGIGAVTPLPAAPSAATAPSASPAR